MCFASMDTIVGRAETYATQNHPRRMFDLRLQSERDRRVQMLVVPSRLVRKSNNAPLLLSLNKRNERKTRRLFRSWRKRGKAKSCSITNIPTAPKKKFMPQT